ncbi:MAG: DUF3298 and DUF4163 domain-containing protein [Clostridiales bacterium]|jgi:hypothetical protein|nr:DUF3298 and DUF4163 domain-containing protein [Clostridiales bacterium]
MFFYSSEPPICNSAYISDYFPGEIAARYSAIYDRNSDFYINPTEPDRIGLNPNNPKKTDLNSDKINLNSDNAAASAPVTRVVSLKDLNNRANASDERGISYKVTYEQNGVLSFYRDEYVYKDGDAHGLTTRTSKTVDLNDCKTLTLDDFFKTRKERGALLDAITRQAEQNAKSNSVVYFENYKRLIKEKFKPDNFYLSGDKVVIYYQQYDIAPYSSGIIEFSVPYKAAR